MPLILLQTPRLRLHPYPDPNANPSIGGGRELEDLSLEEDSINSIEFVADELTRGYPEINGETRPTSPGDNP